MVQEKKGQLEMIGIALVIVLIIIGATVFITLSIRPQSNVHTTFAQKELAQNIVDALVKTSTSCEGLDFAGVLEDCAKNEDHALICADTRSTCDYAREEIANILNIILAEKEVEYRFSIREGDQFIADGFYDITTSGCTKELIDNGRVTVETPGVQPIPLYPGTMTLMLQLCMPRG